MPPLRNAPRLKSRHPPLDRPMFSTTSSLLLTCLICSASGKLELTKFLPLVDLLPFNVPNIQPPTALQAIKRPQGCLPYLDQIAQTVWTMCKARATTQTGNTVSVRIERLLSGSGIDLKGALKEMCETSVQKETCDKLGGHLTRCDVFGGIATLISYRQARERCSAIYKSLEQPQNLPGHIGGLLLNEFAGNLVQKLFGTPKT